MRPPVTRLVTSVAVVWARIYTLGVSGEVRDARTGPARYVRQVRYGALTRFALK